MDHLDYHRTDVHIKFNKKICTLRLSDNKKNITKPRCYGKVIVNQKMCSLFTYGVSNSNVLLSKKKEKGHLVVQNI